MTTTEQNLGPLPAQKEKKPIPNSWVVIAILLMIDLQLLYVLWFLPDVP